MGKQHGMELGADNTYSDKEMSRMHDAWYDEGYEAGKKEATSDIEMQWMHDQWYNEGYADGYKQGKQAGISKINLNTEPVEQTELSKEYDKGFTKGYEEGFEEGKSEGYEIGKKANGISKKEIPGEYLSHIEEAYDDGYKEGYTDCREVAKMLNKYGIDEDGVEYDHITYEAGVTAVEVGTSNPDTAQEYVAYKFIPKKLFVVVIMPPFTINSAVPPIPFVAFAITPFSL